MSGPHKANWHGKLGPQVRQQYNTSLHRVETQYDLAGNGFWQPIDAIPAHVICDHFTSPILIGAAPARVQSSDGWVITEVGTGAVTVIDDHGGGIQLAADAQNDEAMVVLGQSNFIQLGSMPHIAVGIGLQQNDTDFYAELGFVDAAGTTYFRTEYEATEWRVKRANAAAEASTALTATPDTSYHIHMFRISDDTVGGDGTRIEVAVDGVLDDTFDDDGDASYPDVTDNMHFYLYAKNNKVGGGNFRIHLHHFNLVMNEWT